MGRNLWGFKIVYTQYPSATEVKPQVTPDARAVEMQIDFATHKVPERVLKLLKNLGWTEVGSDPDTGEDLFHKENPSMGGDYDPDLNLYWRWYEAMAYEFGKFIDIGMER